MKTSLILLQLFLVCLCSGQVSRQKIGSNRYTIAPSAALEIESTDKGILLPRMSKSDMNNIKNPVNGLIVFDTDNQCVKIYQRNAWSGCFEFAGAPAFSLKCQDAVWSAKPKNGEPFSGTLSLPYIEGGTQVVPAQTIYPTGAGVGTLSAILSAQTLALGAGTLSFNLTGTVTQKGTALFEVNVLGNTCSLSTSIGSIAGNPEDFATDNLGATQSTLLNGSAVTTITEAMFGDYYNWGGKTVVANTTGVQSSFALNASGSWQDGTKTANDPCPPGYRVPTIAQLRYLNNKNSDGSGTTANNGITITSIGSWDATSLGGAVYTKNNKSLVIPASGYYDSTCLPPCYSATGSMGLLWSSSEKDKNFKYALKVSFLSSVVKYVDNPPPGKWALPVRCILQD